MTSTILALQSITLLAFAITNARLTTALRRLMTAKDRLRASQLEALRASFAGPNCPECASYRDHQPWCSWALRPLPLDVDVDLDDHGIPS